MSEESLRKKNIKKEWEKDGLKLQVIWVRDHYCGYVTFPKRVFREQGYHGFLTYVPVHGGITYAEQEKDSKAITYGFDCAHCDDWMDYRCSMPSYDQTKLHKWTEEEVIAETEKLAKGLQVAIKFEKRYLTNISNKGKAKVIDEYLKELGKNATALNDNFGVNINLLSGKL